MTTQQPSKIWPKTWLNRRGLAALLGILILGGLGLGYWRQQVQKQQLAAEEAAKPLPEQVKVAALGRVEPAGGVVNVAASESGVISQLLVKEGDRVTKGQILAYLDLYDVRQAERDYAASQLAEAEQSLQAQLDLGEARVREANTRVAQVDLPEAQSMRAQQAEIRDLQAQLNLARTDLARFERLASQGAIAQQELDGQIAQVDQIQQQITSANATLAQLESARAANLDNASAQTTTAERDLQLSQANAGIQSAERNLALAEAQLARTIVVAPSNGQVIEVFVEPGERVGESNTPSVLSLGNTQTMQVVAEVYETDVDLVKVGQNATIRSRNGAFDEALTGTVSNVALQIFKNDVLDDDPAAESDARVVEVDITVDQPAVIDSLTNLQVDVVIDVEAGS
jgi:HlyD family secretion protein